MKLSRVQLSGMTWQDEVRKELARYNEQTDSAVFTLQEFYQFSEDRLSARYPSNNHVQAKIRQVLQQLRDQGEIDFIDERGTYRSDNPEETAEDSTASGKIEILSQIESDFENI